MTSKFKNFYFMFLLIFEADLFSADAMFLFLTFDFCFTSPE